MKEQQHDCLILGSGSLLRGTVECQASSKPAWGMAATCSAVYAQYARPASWRLGWPCDNGPDECFIPCRNIVAALLSDWCLVIPAWRVRVSWCMRLFLESMCLAHVSPCPQALALTPEGQSTAGTTLADVQEGFRWDAVAVPEFSAVLCGSHVICVGRTRRTKDAFWLDGMESPSFDAVQEAVNGCSPGDALAVATAVGQKAQVQDVDVAHHI